MSIGHVLGLYSPVTRSMVLWLGNSKPGRKLLASVCSAWIRLVFSPGSAAVGAARFLVNPLKPLCIVPVLRAVRVPNSELRQNLG